MKNTITDLTTIYNNKMSGQGTINPSGSEKITIPPWSLPPPKKRKERKISFPPFIWEHQLYRTHFWNKARKTHHRNLNKHGDLHRVLYENESNKAGREMNVSHTGWLMCTEEVLGRRSPRIKECPEGLDFIQRKKCDTNETHETSAHR